MSNNYYYVVIQEKQIKLPINYFKIFSKTSLLLNLILQQVVDTFRMFQLNPYLKKKK